MKQLASWTLNRIMEPLIRYGDLTISGVFVFSCARDLEWCAQFSLAFSRLFPSLSLSLFLFFSNRCTLYEQMCERMRIIHGPCYTCQWRTMACKLLIYLVLIRDRRFCLLPLLVEWTAPCTTHVRTNCELHISLLSEKYHDIWSKWIQVRYSWRNSSRNGSTESFVWLCMRVLGVLTIFMAVWTEWIIWNLCQLQFKGMTTKHCLAS